MNPPVRFSLKDCAAAPAAEDWQLEPLKDFKAGSMPELIADMEATLQPLIAAKDEKRYFHALYLRNTHALLREWQQGSFLDAEWFHQWDVVFGLTYLTPLVRWSQGLPVTNPWQRAFEVARDPHLTPLRHLLIMICIHLNYDLPRTLLRVMSDEEFSDPAAMERRRQDYSRLDAVLLARVAEEDRLLRQEEEPGDRPGVAVLLTPFNRLGMQRFLVEMRAKVWRNAQLLSQARRQGPDALRERVRQLDALTRERIEQVLQPGQVLLKLGLFGFGVRLPESGAPTS